MSPASVILRGRERECEALAALVDSARAGGSGALVVLGSPGLGKTALLDHAAAAGAGITVLRATGVEAEAELPFAGLHQLLSRCLGGATALAPAQAGALQRALALAAGPAPEPLLLGAGVLALLADVAPVVALVDDVHWLDAGSLRALTFAARRLHAEGVALVFAGRHPVPELEGLRVLGLAPLDAAGSSAVLGAGLASQVRDALLAAAAGNPLALVELRDGLTCDQARGRHPLDAPLPVPAQLEGVYRARLNAVDAASRRSLLVAAVEGTGDLDLVRRAAGVRAGLDGLDVGGLTEVVDGRLAWRHPLAREAVLRAAGAEQLRAAHRDLAVVADPDSAAWHRAAAAVGPEARVAAALAAAAERAAGRSAHAEAAAAFARAAQLSCDPDLRSARRVMAAGAAWSAGQADRARAELDAAEPIGDPAWRAEATRILGAIELHRGSPARAHRLLAEAAAGLEPIDADLALRLGVAAMEAASLAGEPPQSPLRAGASRDGFLRTFVVGIQAHLAGDVGTAAPALRTVVVTGRELDDPQLVLWAGAAAFFTGDEEAAVGLHERAAMLARAAGDVAVLPFALTFLAAAHLWNGRPAVAEAEAGEAHVLATEAGQDNLVVQVETVLAGVAALRGEAEACRNLAVGARAAARARGLVLAEGAAEIALAELDLALGAPDAAFRRVDRLAHGAGTHVAHRYGTLPLLVEAAVRAGRRADARPAAELFAAWSDATGSGWAQPLAARGLALVSEGADADAHFAEALARHDAHRRPLDRARTELLLGERLRRARRKTEARGPLRAALEAFEDAGAALWAERARDELRAAGESAPARAGRRLDRLTPQELRIARLVARGDANRDVAAALFLSPRTVEYHLHKVFRKLGVRGRAELAAIGAERDWANHG